MNSAKFISLGFRWLRIENIGALSRCLSLDSEVNFYSCFISFYDSNLEK